MQNIVMSKDQFVGERKKNYWRGFFVGVAGTILVSLAAELLLLKIIG